MPIYGPDIYSNIGSASIREEAKNGDFYRVQQQYPEVYEALLKAGIAPKRGVPYSNYIVGKGASIHDVAQEKGIKAKEKESEIKAKEKENGIKAKFLNLIDFNA